MTLTHKVWRRTVGASLALLLVAGLAACGGDSSETTAGALGDEVPAEDVTVKIWTFQLKNYEGGEEAYGKVVEAFNEEYPQVTIEFESIPYPTYFDKVRNATIARTGPDIVSMYGGEQAYSYRNGLAPLQDSIDPELEDDLKYLEDNYSRDGKLYVMPTGAYGWALQVNQDIFEDAGLDPATGLADWESLLATCTALNSQGIEPISSAWRDGFMFETYMYMMTSQMMEGETFASWTAGEIPVDDDIFTTATQYILDMNEAGCFGGEEGLGRAMWMDSWNNYNAGGAAMAITGSLSTSEGGQRKQPGTTVYPLPQVPESQFDAPFIDAGAEIGWSVTTWTEHPEASAAFVNFIASPEAQQILWDEIGIIPSNKSLDVETRTSIEEAYVPLVTNPDNHTGFASFPLPVLAVYERNASSLIGGTMTAEEFTQQAQAAYEQSQ
jgi:ABC-type glycerol-3-phosphate transport system substrate-binding protein